MCGHFISFELERELGMFQWLGPPRANRRSKQGPAVTWCGNGREPMSRCQPQLSAVGWAALRCGNKNWQSHCGGQWRVWYVSPRGTKNKQWTPPRPPSQKLGRFREMSNGSSEQVRLACSAGCPAPPSPLDWDGLEKGESCLSQLGYLSVCSHSAHNSISQIWSIIRNTWREFKDINSKILSSKIWLVEVRWEPGTRTFKEHPCGSDQLSLYDKKTTPFHPSKAHRALLPASPQAILASATLSSWFIDTAGPLRPLSSTSYPSVSALLLQANSCPALRHSSDFRSAEKPS